MAKEEILFARVQENTWVFSCASGTLMGLALEYEGEFVSFTSAGQHTATTLHEAGTVAIQYLARTLTEQMQSKVH